MRKRWSQKRTTIKVAARLAQARMHKAPETGAPALIVDVHARWF